MTAVTTPGGMAPAAYKLRQWRESPLAFVTECFGATPDSWQGDVLSDFPHCQRQAMSACKGPGKSTVLAWLVWNFLATRPEPKVACTSVTGDNLADGLWAELSKWQGKSEFLKTAFAWTKERIYNRQRPETWWASARTFSKDADPNQQANTLAGLHADYLLFVVDESGDVPEGVLSAAEAGLATGAETHLVQAGNPTRTAGPLHRACTRERHLWRVYFVTGDPDDPKRSSRIDIEWAKAQRDKYGPDHPWYLVNVKGQFPPGQSNTLIGADAANAAMGRQMQRAEYLSEPRILGVDVARFGDDATVLCARQGRACLQVKQFRNLDTMEVAGQVGLSLDKWQPDAVFVDATGVGAGVVDRLRELGHVHVLGIESGAKALGNEPKCLNRRAEMWWRMADWLKAGGCLPEDSELVSELTGPTFKYNSRGELVLESKDDMKKRGLPSPNKADALAFTFAEPVARRDPYAGVPGYKRGGCVSEYNPFQERGA